MSSNTKALYDTIGAKYGIFKTLPTELIETSNLRAVIRSKIPPGPTDLRALDLACGTGFYTRKLVEEWGFTSAVGVDVSQRMIDLASQLTATSNSAQNSTAAPTTTASTSDGGLPHINKSPRLQFRVGDALALDSLAEGPFDLVLGNWLFNYASTEEQLTAMFRSISVNLKNGGGGVFVGIVYPPIPANEMDVFAERENRVSERRKESAMRISVRYIERNMNIATPEGGWGTEVTAYRDEGPGEGRPVEVQFGNYHLPREVYERAARRAGLRGRLEWKEVLMLEEIREAAVRRCGEEFWREYFGTIGPHFSILVVEKGEPET